MKILLNAQIPVAVQLLKNHENSLAELYKFARNLGFDNRGDHFKSITPHQWIETSVNRTLLRKKEAEMGLAEEMPELASEDTEWHLIKVDHLKACLKNKMMTTSDLVFALTKSVGVGEATAWRAISRGGYLHGKLKHHGNGLVTFKGGK